MPQKEKKERKKKKNLEEHAQEEADPHRVKIKVL